MHESMSSAGLARSPAASSTAWKANGNSSRLTTKPGTSGTSTTVLPMASHSSVEAARVASSASSGKASSTRSMRCTGLNTCRPANLAGRPLSAASLFTLSDEVVVASTASSARWPEISLSSDDLGVVVLG